MWMWVSISDLDIGCSEEKEYQPQSPFSVPESAGLITIHYEDV